MKAEEDQTEGGCGDGHATPHRCPGSALTSGAADRHADILGGLTLDRRKAKGPLQRERQTWDATLAIHQPTRFMAVVTHRMPTKVRRSASGWIRVPMKPTAKLVRRILVTIMTA